MRISEYRAVWVMVMFDLPVETNIDKRNYTRFVKFLKKDGFTRLQYSVYVRHCASEENGDVHERRVTANLPPHGRVSMLFVTERQFSRMRNFFGHSEGPGHDAPSQLELF